MKLEIEISEEDAACIWMDNRRERTVRDIVEGLVKTEARFFRRAFPKAKPLQEFQETAGHTYNQPAA